MHKPMLRVLKTKQATATAIVNTIRINKKKITKYTTATTIACIRTTNGIL